MTDNYGTYIFNYLCANSFVHCMICKYFSLWGDHGQKNLENAKVCLINATALGTEILKSLVLPGIGSFTIVDDKKITEEDIGSKLAH